MRSGSSSDCPASRLTLPIEQICSDQFRDVTDHARLDLEEIPDRAGDRMSVVVLISPEGLVGVVIVTVAQEHPDVIPDAARDAGGFAVLLGSGTIGDSDRRVILVVVRKVVEVTEGQVGLVVDDERGREVDGPVVVLRIEDGLGVV